MRLTAFLNEIQIPPNPALLLLEQTGCGIMNALMKFRPDLRDEAETVPASIINDSVEFLKKHGLWDRTSEELFQRFEDVRAEYENIYGQTNVEEQDQVYDILLAQRDKLMCRVARAIKASRTDESRLDELQLPRSPEFYQWFKGSKVVDDEGNPLPVFHGTESHVPFDTPRPWSHFGTSKAAFDRLIPSPAMYGLGTVGAKIKKEIEPARTMPVYLNIKNPLEVEDPEDQHDPHMWMSVLWNTGKFKNLRRLEVAEMNGEERFYQEATSFLLAHGYDGIFYQNRAEDPGSISWVPVHGDQIRTAITENINETIEGEWGGGWHNIHTGKDVYEENMPHWNLAHKNKEEFGTEVIQKLGRTNYNSLYKEGWIRYFWAVEEEESFMEFTANNDGLERAMPWIIDTGKKNQIRKILISNRYSEDNTKGPRENFFYLINGEYVSEDQAPKEVVNQKSYW